MERGEFLKYLLLVGTRGPLFDKNPLELANCFAETGDEDLATELAKLLPRLELKEVKSNQVKEAEKEPEKIANKLLHHFKTRDSIKFFIKRKPDTRVPEIASPKDIKIANNALKHIFIGQPEYPPYFVGDDIKWDTNPYTDKEWVWQLNRMYFWNAMARVYWATNNEKYAKAWAKQILDWIDKNPHDGHHAYAWRSIEAGIRGSEWTKLFRRFFYSSSFTPRVLVSFLNSIYEHASYLMEEYSKGSNWALIEAQGLGFIAIFFPEFKASIKWREEAIGRFKKEINRQVYSDGFQKELAMGYHVGAIRWFLHTFELAKMNGFGKEFPVSYLRKIENMCDVVMKLILPDGTTAQFGDSWRGKPNKHKSQFQKWAKLFSRKDFEYLATNGEKGIPPQFTAFALKESGYYSLRSGWDHDAICFILKCGPDGGFHCQPDNGSFVLYAGGRHLMPDSGSYTYSEQKGRDWFRQTKVHQTLTLNGENSAYKPHLLLWKPRKDLGVLVVENQSYPNLKHRRAVLFVKKKFFIIIDEAIGRASGDVAIHFQLAPGQAIYNQEKMTARTNFSEGFNVSVQTLVQKGLTMEKEKGQVSFVYTKKEKRPAFSYHLIKKNNINERFISIVTPYKKSLPEMDIKILNHPRIGSRKIDLKVEIPDWRIQERLGYEF